MLWVKSFQNHLKFKKELRLFSTIYGYVVQFIITYLSPKKQEKLIFISNWVEMHICQFWLLKETDEQKIGF